jgi:hypothetical protein
MPYSHTTYGQLQTQLAGRLGDASNIFWTTTEIKLHLRESLRTFGLCTGFWRERATLPSSSGTAFYNLNALLTNGSELILAPSVTDRDIIEQLQYALLEPATTQASWTGTEMFTHNDLAKAVQNRLNQFLSDTGIVVTRSLVGMASPPIGRQVLAQATIDVRRAAWLGASPEAYYTTLWREDERSLTANSTSWGESGTPSVYSVMAPPPLQIQVSPPPSSSGQLELLTVDSTALDPATSATVLGIPDDLTPAVKWGALADLLGIDGIASDPLRAQFATERYQQYVQLARNLPVVLNAELNGVPLIPATLQELDSSTPNWQNIQGTPEDVILAAPNLIGLSKVPDGIYSVTLDVVRRTPMPTGDGAYIQIGREQVDMVLDYAEHLALFKVSGQEWQRTLVQANNFLVQALTFNQRLGATARTIVASAGQSQKQKADLPRRSESTQGAGAMKGV